MMQGKKAACVTIIHRHPLSPEARAALNAGLRSAKTHPLVYLGNFTMKEFLDTFARGIRWFSLFAFVFSVCWITYLAPKEMSFILGFFTIGWAWLRIMI